MGDIEGVIPCVAFVESGSRFEVESLQGIERCVERPVWQYGAECPEFFAIVVFVAQRTFGESLGIFFVS